LYVLEAVDNPGLEGVRVLVAEDEFAIAMFLVDYLELKGVQVVGPAGDLAALGRLVDEQPIDVALLDINLGGQQVYPLADRLVEAGIPFLLTSGYDDNVPSRFADVPRCAKPYHIQALAQQLETLVQATRAAAGGH
jgi:CheY-like chemotaxis protein